MEIIPAILAKNFEEVQEKIRLVEPFSSWAQLDIVDGIFASNTTWDNPEDLRSITTDLNFEAHLMVNDVMGEVEKWINSDVKRIIFNIESMESQSASWRTNLKNLIDKIHNAGKEAGVALNPQTPWQEIESYLSNLDAVLFLSVNPGFYGSPFVGEVIPKIKAFHEAHPSAIIAIDGGINDQTASEAIEVGVSRLCVGSYIFKSDNIEQAINNLKNA